MKLIRILFQIAVLLVIPLVFSQSLWADTSDTLQKDTLFAQSAPSIKSHPAQRSASTILAGFETGFMDDVVPMVALFLFGRAVWMLIPFRRMEEASNPAPRPVSRRPSWIESESMAGRALASLVAFENPIWLWMIAPRTGAGIVEEKPHVDVPPLRSLPERITIF